MIIVKKADGHMFHFHLITADPIENNMQISQKKI